MKIQKIPISQIRPNSWNPNEMPPALFARLVEKIKRVGYSQPIEVRPLPANKLDPVDGHLFEIVDGEHRYLACQEAGLKEIECVVSEYTETEAKTETLAKNKLKGEFDPVRTAALIADLKDDLKLPELEELTGFTLTELDNHLKLEGAPALEEIFAKINDDSTLQIEDIRFACSKKDMAEIKAIIDQIRKEIKPELSGEILLTLCQTYAQATR